jgi:haloalkane dehalogenase
LACTAIRPGRFCTATSSTASVEQGLPLLAHLPVLIVWGDRDRAFKEPQRRRWEHSFPNHQTVLLHGASHYIQEDAPEEIVAAIKQWWPGS